MSWCWRWYLTVPGLYEIAEEEGLSIGRVPLDGKKEVMDE